MMHVLLRHVFVAGVVLLLLIGSPTGASAVEPGSLAALEKRMAAMETAYRDQIDRLEARVASLSKALDEVRQGRPTSEAAPFRDEAEELRRAALQELEGTETVPTADALQGSERRFVVGLQAENPEISVTGEMVLNLQNQAGTRRVADATFRTLGVHVESYLDPSTKFKSAFPILENGTAIGEAYITRFGFGNDLNLTLGKFRQQFGVVNRWHKHALDTVDFPLALRRIFGDGGLNQMGVALDWQLAQGTGGSRGLTLQLTEATNPRLFGGNTKGIPSALVHWKTYRDVDRNTYQELGLTALVGANDRWTTVRGGALTTEDETRPTLALGLNFTRFWEPSDNMRYRNFLWRTELYGLAQEILATDGSGRDTLRAWGGYTNVQWKLNRQLEAGLRYDYFRPDTKPYAALAARNLFPLAVPGGNAYEWQVGPYMTWHQSPWVRYRLEFNYKSARFMEPEDRRIMLQCIWAAGPHKHDRY